MKKSKLLLGSLALSVALMGTGYAWWTESVVAKGTVATAKMDVVIISAELSGVDKDDNDQYLEFDQPIINRGEDEVIVGNKEIEFEILKMYPNSTAQLDVTVQNIGTIGVKVNDVLITTADGNLIDHLEFSADGNAFGPLSDLKSKLETALGNEEIAPQLTESFTIYIRMPENDEDETGIEFEDMTKMDQKFGFLVNFAQFNNVNPAATPISLP